MAQWVLRLGTAGGSGTDVYQTNVAPTNAAGAYIAAKNSGSGNTWTLLKTDQAGTLIWAKQTTTPAGTGSMNKFILAANGSHVAVASDHVLSSVDGMWVAKLGDSDGSITWQKRIAGLYPDSFRLQQITRIVGVDSSGNVYVTGRDSSGTFDTKQVLIKLSVTDGSIVWQKNYLDTGTATADQPISVAILPSDDLAITLTASNVPVLHKVSGTDGSIIWTRRITMPSTSRTAFVAGDPSGNIYVAGNVTTAGRVAVVKFDSSGATTWNKNIVLSGGQTFILAGGAVADASGLFVSGKITYSIYNSIALLTINSAGTAANAISYDGGFGNTTSGLEDIGLASASSVFAVGQQADVIGDVYKQDINDFTSLTFGAYSRTAHASTTETGTATVDTPSLTMPSNPSYSVSAVTLTVANAPAEFETSLTGMAIPDNPPHYATSIAPSGRFGTPRESNSYQATSIAPSGGFGTPALDYDLETYAVGFRSGGFGTPDSVQFAPFVGPYYATSIQPTTGFGTPTSIADLVGYASSIEPTVEFGTPTLLESFEASGFNTTAFGTPTLLESFAASGFSTTAFGTPVLTVQGQASGFNTTAFGTPSSIGIHFAEGFSSTRFGTPAAVVGASVHNATGFSSGGFGTPTSNVVHLASSIVNRSQFGTPRVVQVC